MDTVSNVQVKNRSRSAVLDVRLALSAVHILVTPGLQGEEASLPRTEAAGPGPWRLKTRPCSTFDFDKEVTLRLGL